MVAVITNKIQSRQRSTLRLRKFYCDTLDITNKICDNNCNLNEGDIITSINNDKFVIISIIKNNNVETINCIMYEEE